MKVTPASNAAWIVATDCAAGISALRPLSGAVPKPSRDTLSAVRPTCAGGSVVFIMPSLSHPEQIAYYTHDSRSHFDSRLSLRQSGSSHFLGFVFALVERKNEPP